MFRSVLKLRSVTVGAVVLGLAAFALAVGCVSQMALSDLSHLSHMEGLPAVLMGKMVKRGVECVDCHTDAKTAERPSMPGHAFCVDCHDEMKDKDRFVLGGEFFDASGKPKWKHDVDLPDDMKFSHANHANRQKCEDCHGDIANDDYSLVDLAARFENCKRCHGQKEMAGNCNFCHEKLHDKSVPHSHDAQWERRHGRYVRDTADLDGGEALCIACHSGAFCNKCHREQKPRDHSVFFTRAGHSLAADIDRDRCTTCHTEDRCVRCHFNNKGPAKPAGHPAVSNCTSCHSSVGVRAHLFLTDNCAFCHD